MSQALATVFPPPLRRDLAAVLVGRKRPTNPYARRDWLRTSQRLAAGMTPEAVALAEGTEPQAVEALLARPDFQGLVDSFARLIARPAEAQRARLVRLARLALETALSDWDAGTAVFVLDQDARGQDPAETLAEAALAKVRRAATAIPPARAPEPAPAPRPAAPGRYDPLDGLVRRSASALQAGLLAEHALHHATGAGEPLPPRPRAEEAPPAEPASPSVTTAEAARRALALRQAAAAPSSPAARLARRLRGEAAASTLLPVEPARPRLAGLPCRPRGP
jgi:hypothetical protein